MTPTNHGGHSPAKQPFHDAITAEEIAGNAIPNMAGSPIERTSSKRPNAFTKLMSKSKKAKPAVVAATDMPGTLEKGKKAVKGWDPRDGLGVYIDSPETNPEGRVIEYDDEFVLINDKFPKASVHLLLIPRKQSYYDQHPLRALSTDAAFRAEVSKRVARIRLLAASELRRQYGEVSASDKPYQESLETMMSLPDPPPPEERDALLPSGRDWAAEIVTGVHTHPSMNHLHIHIFSREMQSPWMKHKRHYLSFNTSFLVQLHEFPLEEGSERYRPGDWPSWDMKCWRCGKNFANKFAALRQHLGEEFEGWKRE